jgi:hypothetical protein
MKTPFLIFFCFTSLFGISQILPDSVAKKYHISRVVSTVQNPFYKNSYTEYYNANGKVIKDVRKSKGGDPQIEIRNYYYNDKGLLKKWEYKEYYERKLMSGSQIICSYNKDNLLISEVSTDNNKRITIDTFVYSKDLKTDTLFSFSNDTMIYKPAQNGYDFGVGKSLHLEKETITYYDSGRKKIRLSELDYRIKNRCIHSRTIGKPDSTGYRLIEYYNNADTTIEKETFWYCTEGVQRIQINYNKFPTNSNVRIYESFGRITEVIEKRNALNFLTESVSITKVENKIESKIRTIYQY